MGYTSSTSRATIIKFLAMTMAELSLQGRMIVAVTDGSLSYTEKHTSCGQNCGKTIWETIYNKWFLADLETIWKNSNNNMEIHIEKRE